MNFLYYESKFNFFCGGGTRLFVGVGGGAGLELVNFFTKDPNLKKKCFGGGWRVGVRGG